MPAEEPPAKMARTGSASQSTLRLRKLRLITAIKTPYTAEGTVDFAAFDRHVDHQLANGVEGFIIGGTTGEGHLLSWPEHLDLIAHAKAKVGDRAAIIGNTGGMNTAEADVYTKKGFALGMDGSLLINPYYGKTSARGIVMHLEAGLQFGPAFIYNVPGRTGQDIKPEVLKQIKDHKHFIGVKECMGHARIKELADMGILSWSGNDDECHLSRHVYGAVGVISVTSNIVPGLMRQLMHGERNDELDEKLKALYKWLFTDPNPIGVNTLLMQLGCAKPVFRLPYTYAERSLREQAVEIVKSIGLEHMPGEGRIQVLEDSDFKHAFNGDVC